MMKPYHTRILFVLLLICISSCAKNSSPVYPKYQSVTEAVYASGHVLSGEEFQLFSQADGILRTIHVQPGDSVAQDALLFVIENEQQRAQERMTQERLSFATRNANEHGPVLSELRSALSALKTKLSFDSLTYRRYEALRKENISAQADYDRSKLVYEQTKAELQAMEQRWQTVYQQVQLELRLAQEQWVASKDEQARYAIRSPIAGVLFHRTKERGELVRKGELLAVLGNPHQPVLRLKVDELDVSKLSVGLPVLVSVDAYPDSLFHASITRIYPFIDPRDQSFRVDAVPSSSFPAGFSGLSLEANIIIRKQERAMVIPRSYVLAGDSVFVEQQGALKKQHIKIGIRSLELVEVLSGLTSETAIYRP